MRKHLIGIAALNSVLVWMDSRGAPHPTPDPQEAASPVRLRLPDLSEDQR